jgi:hypothetical protein
MQGTLCVFMCPQIRRMFAAVGHQVVGLHRHTIGGLKLDGCDLAEGSWRLATADEITAVLSGPDLQEVLLQQQEGHVATEDVTAVVQPGYQAGRGRPEKVDDPLLGQGKSPIKSSSSSSKHMQPPLQEPAWYAEPVSAFSNSSSSSSRTPGTAAATGANDAAVGQDGSDGVLEDGEELEFEEEEEQARYSRTFRNSSRWARRRAVMARNVAKIKLQQQQLQQQQPLPQHQQGLQGP